MHERKSGTCGKLVVTTEPKFTQPCTFGMFFRIVCSTMCVNFIALEQKTKL